MSNLVGNISVLQKIIQYVRALLASIVTLKFVKVRNYQNDIDVLILKINKKTFIILSVT